MSEDHDADVPEEVDPSVNAGAADDFIDIGDMPELPVEEEDHGVQDAFSYAVGFRLAFVGVGHCGSRFAEEFYKMGYRSVCAVNTAVSDLAKIQIPETNKLNLGGGGAGKDPSIAAAAAEDKDEELFDLYKTTLGDEIDYAFICLGAGGGTGAGAWKKAYQVLERYLDENKRPKRIGVIVALPKNSEGQRPAKNALDVVTELQGTELSPVIVVDNERIQQIFRKTPPAKFWGQCNGQICQLFHLFNRIAAQDSPHTSFDRQDLAKLLDSGVVAFGATAITEYQKPADISRAVRQQLQANILASTDLSQGHQAGCIFICGKEAYETMDSDVLEHGFESLNRILGKPSTVFRGVYQGNNDAIRSYVLVGDLPYPEARLKELRKLAGGD